MKRTLFFLSLLFTLPAIANDGVTIKVTVTNIPGAKGNLLVGLYDDASSFTDKPLPNSPKVPIESGEDITITLDGVKPGTYAISVIQDLNENGKLDKTILGMPKEPLAFSVITKIPKGKPKFENCAFTVSEEDVEMTIPLTLE